MSKATLKTKSTRRSLKTPALVDLLSPSLTPPAVLAVSPDVALRPLLTAWIRSKAQRSVDTADTYDSACTTFLTFVAKFDLTPKAIEAYEDSMRKLSANTQAHHISAVRGFLTFLRRQNLCESILLDLLVRPRVPAPDMGDILDKDEAALLLAASANAGKRFEVAIALPLLTGLRVGEVCGARFSDLRRDPLSGEIVLYVVGKGSKSRTVMILPELFKLLCNLHSQKGLNARCKRPLIPNRLGKPYSRFGFGKLIRSLSSEAGLSHVISPHALRRTHATLAAAGGASAFDIQNTLGHARLETSARYTRYAQGLQNSTAKFLPSFSLVV